MILVLRFTCILPMESFLIKDIFEDEILWTVVTEESEIYIIPLRITMCMEFLLLPNLILATLFYTQGGFGSFLEYA